MLRVGRRIKEMRQALDLTQAAFGERCYVTQAAVSQWELGRTMPRPAVQRLIADQLRMTRHTLFAEVLDHEAAA
jgi:transcriptional regulator with XRE-family HTH domain